MFAIKKKLQSQQAGEGGASAANAKKTVDMRQKLLQKEFESMKQTPVGCSIHFDNPDVLHIFKLVVVPDKDSLWFGGKFEFLITVPEGYKINCFFLI
jgi:ubiquitin-protein ligase